MRGIVLAGGTGSRLYPLTMAVSKQLMPVYDKPMIYYPLSTLMLTGIRDILIVTNPHESDQFKRVLGDGSKWGIQISYANQDSPRGIADALIVGEDFIGNEPVALILGDNIFHGPGLGTALSRIGEPSGAIVMAYQVSNPSEYGVIEFDRLGRALSIEEKPANPRSNYVVPGLYFYSSGVSEMVRSLKPSARGEIEITDLNRMYLDADSLQVIRLERGIAWLDTGTFDSLLEAGEFVRIVEKRQGYKIGSPEEVAWRKGYISAEELSALALKTQKSGYGEYLLRVLPE